MPVLVTAIIFFFLGAFEVYTRRFLNPYKLIMVFGKKGSGKTTFLTKTAIKAIKQGVTVYSTVRIPGTIYFDSSEVGKKSFGTDSIILIDEVGMIWDNRDFKNFKTSTRDWFKLQRQNRNTVYLFSQTFDIDKKLRDLTDKMYLLKNFCRVWSVAHEIDKHITISTDKDNNGQLSETYAFVPFILGGYKFTYIPRWVCYFKSFDPKQLPLISGEKIPFNEIQSEYLNTKNWVFGSLKLWFIGVVRVFRRFKPYRKLKRLVAQFTAHHALHDKEDGDLYDGF